MPTLNIADLSLAIIWLFFCIRGYLRGFVKEVGSLAAIVAGFYCAGTYHKALAPHLTSYISGNYADTAAYLILFTVSLLAVWFAALAVSGIVRITMTQWADRFFGGGFGLLKGVVLSAVLLFLIHLAAPEPDFLKGSLLAPELRKVSARLAEYIPADINEKLRKFGRKDLPDAVGKAVKPAEPARPAERKAGADKKPDQPGPAEAAPKPAEKDAAVSEAAAPAEKKAGEPAKAQPDRKAPSSPRAGGENETRSAAQKPDAAKPAAGQPAAQEKAHE